MKRRIGPVAGALAALLLAAGPLAAGVEVVYLGNEGLAIDDGRLRIVVDALFGAGLDGYPAVPAELRGRLERAEGEFSGIELVLATHFHGDHFDPRAVLRHLSANPRAEFVSTPQAVTQLLALPGADAFTGRARAVLPTENSHRSMAFDTLRITAYNLHHGRGRRPAVENLGFRIEIDGSSLLVVGDTEASADEIARLGPAAQGVDLALLPYWLLERAGGAEGIRRVIAPRRLALFHLPLPNAPREWFGADGSLDGTLASLRALWPGVLTLVRPGERIAVGAAPTPDPERRR